jgi:hypothetical protein
MESRIPAMNTVNRLSMIKSRSEHVEISLSRGNGGFRGSRHGALIQVLANARGCVWTRPHDKRAAASRKHEAIGPDTIRVAGAKTVLYMTWARKHSPDQQQVITDAYESIGQEIGAVVVPVGSIWWRFMSKHEPVALHDKDQSHPTLAGSYLAACAFLVTLFGKSRLQIDCIPNGLSVADAQSLHKAVGNHLHS